MQVSTENILEAAMRLSERERWDLVSRLMETLPPDEDDGLDLMSMDDPGFIAELDRRSADGSTPIPWSQIKKEL